MRTVEEILNKDFGKFDPLFDRLSEYFLGDKKLLVAVSGGPDSMFLSVLILKYFQLNNLDLNNLYFVHCNHKTRVETDEEEEFVKKQLQVTGCKLQVVRYDRLDSSPKSRVSSTLDFQESGTQAQNDRVEGKGDCFAGLQGQMKKTENELRQWRYGEFQKIINENGVDFVLTGHNLTDRIESSFMNMLRGSGFNGFLSMKFLDENHLLKGVKIIRPLLNYTKKEIEKYCKEYDIKFVVDPTNLDEETSLRNKIRLSLFPQLAQLSNKSTQENNSFFDSMKKIYYELEKQNNDIGNLVKIKKSDYRDSDFAFCWDVPLSFVSEDSLLKVLKKFGIFSEITSNTLEEFVNFFHVGEQGYKYINGVYFFLSHAKIYIIKAKENFWQKHIEKSEIIDKLGEINIGKEVVNIDNEEFIRLEVRYPKEGDKFGSKSWGKYCINKKIPIFWRNFIPVIVEGNNIVKYFYE